MGRRLTADAALEEYSLPALSSATAASNACLTEALKTLSELQTTYNIAAADIERLRSQIGNAVAVTNASTVEEAPSSEGVGEGYEQEQAPMPDSQILRTKTPVQLLASTRRIREFSSAKMPSPEDRVVYVCGTFDMFHVGHAEFLKEARELGTFLLVGIYDDICVSGAKGPSFPIMNLNERVLNVCACKWVDEVIIGAPRQVTEDLIKTWDIHVVVKGTQHMRDAISIHEEERFGVAKSLGVYKEVPSKWPELCLETVVQRIISDRETYLTRNRDRAKREDVYYDSKNTVNSPLET